MIFFAPLFRDIDSALTTFVDTAATNIATYVNLTTTIAATITMIFIGLQMSHAATEIPIRKLLITFVTIALVSGIAGVPANYHEYVSQYLMALPADFAAGVSGNNDLANANIGSYLDNTIGEIGHGIAMIFKQGGLTDLGPCFVGALLFIICCLLAVAATISICIGKVGLALVVALGPFFIVCLLTPWTKDFFTRWLSYALHFTVLQGLIAGTLLAAKVLIERYVMILANPTWAFNDMMPVLAPAIVMLVLTFLFAQLPSMASSLTGGIGLSMGNAAWAGVAGATGMVAAGARKAGGAAGRGIAAAGNAGADWGLGQLRGGGNSVSQGSGSGSWGQTKNSVMRAQRVQEASATRTDAQRAPAARSSASEQAFARLQSEMKKQNNETSGDNNEK